MRVASVYPYYCRLCWQEFDDPGEHNAGSYLGRERLNGYCPGDIHLKEHRPRRSRIKAEQGKIEFTGEPLKIK